VSLAARIAGISRPSLHRRIRELGLDMEGFRV
jgi:transcriptional regulator of acetoin/glycerol metabolism